MGKQTTYFRAIPRDLFNEAKLLKCLGQIALAELDKVFPENVEISYDGKPFNIIQDVDGNLECANLTLYKNNEEVILFHPLNNKGSYPLRAEFWGEKDVSVFNENGSFSKEFIDLICE